MKRIAITPNDFDIEKLRQSIAFLRKNGASHIYLRSPLILNNPYLFDLIEFLKENNFIPVLPYDRWLDFKDFAIVCHFRENDKKSFAEALNKLKDTPFSVSCHSISEANEFLEKGADFVFLSPVFPPYSKKIDYPLIDLKSVARIVERFGERVVLLGGMDFDRVEELRVKLDSDFSFGGITCFFGGEK